MKSGRHSNDIEWPRKKGDSQEEALVGLGKFGTLLADPPWRFSNRTGKMAPEHKRLSRYATMTNQQIMELPVAQHALPKSHLYLWVPNALILEGLEVMKRWGFTYKTHLVWYKVRKDGGPDGRGVGFYFRNVTELVLFGVRGSLRTLAPGRRQVNLLATRKREHSRKPDELYGIIEQCSPGPYLELFARHGRSGWQQWGDEIEHGPRGVVSRGYAGGPVDGPTAHPMRVPLLAARKR
jgi:N6-adenosine-specific RNA methylase IME4